MVCYAEQDNQIKPARGNSGASPFCVATLAGSFIGDNLMRSDDYYYGIFDGEGCITNYKRKDTSGQRAWRIEINVTNTHLGVLREFQDRYGGRIKIHSEGNEKWSKCYRWMLEGHYAARWLVKALGHILIKEATAVRVLNDFFLYRTKLAYFPFEYYKHCNEIGHKYHLKNMTVSERKDEHKYRDIWFRDFYGFQPL